MYPNIDDILSRLSKSKFRSSFHLKDKDIEYINKKGLDVIRGHAYDFLNKNIRIKIEKDGKQTPMHGHPVFIAEHATATCCRGCIEKWYKFPQTKELTDKDIDYLVNIIMKWIESEYERSKI